MAQLQADGASGLLGDEEAVPQNGHGTYAVFSVLSNVLDKDEVSLREFEEKDRPKDDYIDHETLREWFSRRLKIATEHHMSLREIWRNFCYEYRIYCSLPLFGNVVLRHVLQADPAWKGVTKVGDIKQKRYNLTWKSEPAGTEFEIDAFFARIKDEKEKVDRTKVEPKPAVPAAEAPAAAGVPRSPVFLDPTLLSEWWNRRLEPTDPSICRMRMRDIYDRFVIETNVNMPKALFGELSVRYVLSSAAYANVVRKGKIHSKRYSLQWRNTPSVPAAAANPAISHAPGAGVGAALPPVSATAAASAAAAAAARASAEARWHNSMRAPGGPVASAASTPASSSAFPRTAATWGPGPHPSAPRVVNV